MTKIALKSLEKQGFFKIQPEFTTLLRQMKSSYLLFVEALQKKPDLEYLLDILAFGEIEEGFY